MPEILRKMHHIDASNKTLGRLATQVADLLRGKNKVTFVPYLDMGDSVTITNAQKIVVTGNKLDNKTFYWHSGYSGGLKSIKLGKLMATKPEEVIKKAVYGMLPKNKLRSLWIRRLKIYAGEIPQRSKAPKTEE